MSADALRRRRARRLRKPAPDFPDSPEHQVPAADRDARPADAQHRLPVRRSATRRRSSRSATSRQRRCRLVHRSAVAARCSSGCPGDEPDDSVASRADGSGNRRARGVAVSAARQRARVGGAVRPGVERDRGSGAFRVSRQRVCRSSKANRSSRSAWISRRPVVDPERDAARRCRTDATSGRAWRIETWPARRTS